MDFTLNHAHAFGITPGAASHPEYPIEKLLRWPDAGRAGPVTPSRQHIAPEGTLLVTQADGLRLLGLTESALRRGITMLQDRLGVRFKASAPRVRYIHGSTILEPSMTILVHGRADHLAMVQRDLARRRGRVIRVQEDDTFLLVGEAALANLLGYADWLATMTGEDPYVGMWLSRYRRLGSPASGME